MRRTKPKPVKIDRPTAVPGTSTGTRVGLELVQIFFNYFFVSFEISKFIEKKVDELQKSRKI